MAGVPQIGDLVKFAELGWTVYNYGWTKELRASRQYQEFGDDVRHLAESLEALSNVIHNANKSFKDRGLLPPDNLTFAWDESSLFDIIGDYEATLNECIRLLVENRAYRSTTSHGDSIVWNVFVQPNVDRLQRRIQFHNSKIQHVLRPFEIDLRLRIHQDIVHRIEGVGDEVRGMRRELQELRRAFDPSLIRDYEDQYKLEDCSVQIPDDVRLQLVVAYDNHPDRDFEGFDSPPLRDLADAFVRSFNMSTRLFRPEGGFREPTEEQYLALLTCQFLMTTMLESNEYQAPTQSSHWPSYVRALRKQLTSECQRFQKYMITPKVSDMTPIPTIWKTNDPPPDNVESVRLPVPMEYLLEMPLKSRNPDRWRRIKLLRYCDGTDRRFRLVFTTGSRHQPASEPRPIDFDISTACLIPRYASYEDPGSLELVLKLSDEMHSLIFCTRTDLYKFQQAITGYEPVDMYMAYHLQVVFVLGSNQKVPEYASMQLWRPLRIDGERVTNDPDNDRSESLAPSTAVPSRSGSRLSTNTGISPFLQQIPLRQSSSPRASTIAGSPIMETPRSPTFDPWAAAPSIQVSGSPPGRPFVPIQYQPGSLSGRNGYTPIRAPSVSSDSSNSSSSTARPLPRGRQGSSVTTGSYNTARTNATSVISTSSTASYATRPVSISGATTLAGTGILHCKPTEPLLVLFTQNCETGHHGIVAITLDKKTNANYRACQCDKNPVCRVAAIERGTGGNPLTLLRLGAGGSSSSARSGSGAQWDLLPLSEPLRGQRNSRARRMNKGWRRVIRVSICLESPELRQELIGLPCNCPNGTEGELFACLQKWHRGRLGLVKELYRREMVRWNSDRYGGQSRGSVIQTSQRGDMPGMGWA